MVQSQRILLIDTEEIIPGVTKLNLRGRLDAPGAQIIDTAFARMARAQERLIVDLSRVSFIASAGLRTLIAGARSLLARQGRMVCLDPDPLVEQVLVRSGVDRLIPVCREISEAVRVVSVGGGAGRGDPEDEPLPFDLEVERTMAGVRRVGAWVDELAILLNLSGETEYALRLCLEEAVTNIVNHAIPQPDIDNDSVALHLLANASTMRLTIEDHCGAFNPLGAPLPEPDSPAPEGEGGLGITLLRRHADQVAWEYTGTANRLSIQLPR
ncbi:MAG TPA: ATP-binding protein [Acetobacteraceae bacterium]|jgi:anti-anti-sigma factor|nr:ATP-binding protein [Acetobacteraceae bacterium]